MYFQLDLAIAFACTLALAGWLASWLVPLAFGALVRALARAVRALRTRHADRRPPGAEPAPISHDWWGPTHHSH